MEKSKDYKEPGREIPYKEMTKIINVTIIVLCFLYDIIWLTALLVIISCSLVLNYQNISNKQW